MEEKVIDTDGQVLTKTTYDDGDIEYLNAKGEYHRIGGPALIWSDGYQAYYVNGKRHRISGPALIYSDGSQFYYADGKLHRTHGPAVIYPDCTVEYWVNDIQYTEEDYLKAVLEYKLKQLVG